MPITVVFDPPLPSDSPEVFNSKAFSTLGDLNDWSTEANALASDVTAKQTTASNAATTATTQAGIATSAASTASTKASEAVNARDVAVQAASDAEDAAAAAALFDPANYVAKSGSTMTGNLNLPSINGGQLAGMRNKIINGKMEIAQRGTIFGSASLDGVYTLDRWVVGNTSAATLTVSQQLGAFEFLNCSRIVVGTPDASIAAGDNVIFQQNIEGFNAYDLVGKTFTISFWVRSSVTGTYAIALRNSGFDRSYVANYTINASDTWEYKTVTVAGGLPSSGGTWNFTSGAGLRVAWVLACGSSLQTTPGVWQTGNFLATSTQANFLATASNTFQITGVQLEVGEVATPFEHRPYGAELALCQRYYEITRAYIIGYNTAGNSIGAPVYWSEKRVTPSAVYGAELATGNATSRAIDSITKTAARAFVNPVATGPTLYSAEIIVSAEL